MERVLEHKLARPLFPRVDDDVLDSQRMETEGVFVKHGGMCERVNVGIVRSIVISALHMYIVRALYNLEKTPEYQRTGFKVPAPT